MGRPRGSKAKEIVYNEAQEVTVEQEAIKVPEVENVEQRTQPAFEFIDKQVLVPGGRKNNDNERIIKIDDESYLAEVSMILTGYNPQTKEARIKVI